MKKISLWFLLMAGLFLIVSACNKKTTQESLVEDYGSAVEKAMSEISDNGLISSETQAELDEYNKLIQEEFSDMTPLEAAALTVQIEQIARPLVDYYNQMSPQAQQDLQDQAMEMLNQYLKQE